MVSASHFVNHWSWVAGNVTTISFKTILLLLAIASIWTIKLASVGDSVFLRVRDVAKTNLQADPTKQFIAFKAPLEAEKDEK